MTASFCFMLLCCSWNFFSTYFQWEQSEFHPQADPGRVLQPGLHSSLLHQWSHGSHRYYRQVSLLYPLAFCIILSNLSHRYGVRHRGRKRPTYSSSFLKNLLQNEFSGIFSSSTLLLLVMLASIYCKALTLCMWPDSEPTKLLYHPQDKNLGGVGASDRQKQLPQSPSLPGHFSDEEILHCLLRVLSFYGVCIVKSTPKKRELLPLYSLYFCCDTERHKICKRIEGGDPIYSNQSPNFKTFKEPKNRFQGINSASVCSLAGRYNNPIPTRFLAPIDCFKIQAQGFCPPRWMV